MMKEHEKLKDLNVELTEIVKEIQPDDTTRHGYPHPDLPLALAYEIRRLKALVAEYESPHSADTEIQVCVYCSKVIAGEPFWYNYHQDEDRMGPFCNNVCRVSKLCL
jgi:hypothetical protein